jgi:hypothetical protein
MDIIAMNAGSLCRGIIPIGLLILLRTITTALTAVRRWRQKMSVIIKGEPTGLEAYMINGIKNCQLNHIKFANVVFGCETIEDANRTIFRKERKGKWVYNSPITMRCSECGLVIKDWDWHRFKYCPNCNANMVGDEKDE